MSIALEEADQVVIQTENLERVEPAQTGFSQRKIVYSETPIVIQSKSSNLRKSVYVESSMPRDNNS